MIDLDPVAALFLGHVTSHVSSPQGRLQGRRRLGDMHQADTHGGHERPALPDKVQVLHGLAQPFGDFFRRVRRAVLQQDPELIPAQPGQGVVFPQP
ncbi:hypothetical protein D3C78_1617800 [compost metagenome]